MQNRNLFTTIFETPSPAQTAIAEFLTVAELQTLSKTAFTFWQGAHQSFSMLQKQKTKNKNKKNAVLDKLMSVVIDLVRLLKDENITKQIDLKEGRLHIDIKVFIPFELIDKIIKKETELLTTKIDKILELVNDALIEFLNQNEKHFLKWQERPKWMPDIMARCVEIDCLIKAAKAQHISLRNFSIRFFESFTDDLIRKFMASLFADVFDHAYLEKGIGVVIRYNSWGWTPFTTLISRRVQDEERWQLMMENRAQVYETQILAAMVDMPPSFFDKLLNYAVNTLNMKFYLNKLWEEAICRGLDKYLEILEKCYSKKVTEELLANPQFIKKISYPYTQDYRVMCLLLNQKPAQVTLDLMLFYIPFDNPHRSQIDAVQSLIHAGANPQVVIDNTTALEKALKAEKRIKDSRAIRYLPGFLQQLRGPTSEEIVLRSVVQMFSDRLCLTLR